MVETLFWQQLRIAPTLLLCELDRDARCDATAFRRNAAKSRLPAHLSRDVHRVSARRCPEIYPARIVGPFFFRYSNIITTAPGGRHQSRVVPSRLNPRPVPTRPVIQ